MQCISCDTFDSFSHSADANIIHTVGITLAQGDFCTLTNNASCSSERENIPHKNDTKWFGIKHSFMICIIMYCLLMSFKIISNFLGVNFFFYSHGIYIYIYKCVCLSFGRTQVNVSMTRRVSYIDVVAGGATR